MRLRSDGVDKFQIFIPGENGDYPIGTVQRIPLKNPPKWKVKPYFMTLFKDDYFVRNTYDDSIEGARVLVDLYNHIESVSKMEITKPYELFFPDDSATD